jgi:uncharacterized protein (DUF2141 family)
MKVLGTLAFLLAMIGSANAATLVIRAQGIQSAQGMVYAGICDRSFDEATCPYKDRTAAKAGTVEMRLTGVKPGTYAIAVFHDLNGDGKLGRNFIGLPNEPYGFSNDVGRRGPPDFNGALITIKDPSATVTISVR